MKRITLLCILMMSVSALAQAQGQWSFKGTVTKMRMIDCSPQRSVMAAMSGMPQMVVNTCPEYTVVSDKVVYVVVGKHANEFIPLAENVDFQIRKNELVTLSDDEKSRSHFVIQQMTMRSEWDREEARREKEKDPAAKTTERSVSYETRNPALTSRTSAAVR